MATTIPTGVKPHVSESPIDLYYSQLSSQCRAVMMVGALLGVKFNVNNVDRGERNLRKMLKRHEVVPFIKDNGLVLTQSIAIMCYLAEKFKKTDTLYPVDLKKRAVVHEMLSFDQRTLYQRFVILYYPLFLNNTSLDPEKKRAMDKGYSIFNNFLAEYKPWADGEHMTIADISLAATVSTAQIAGYDIGDYEHVSRWFKHATKHIPNYDEINQKGINAFQYKVMGIKPNAPKSIPTMAVDWKQLLKTANNGKMNF